MEAGTLTTYTQDYAAPLPVVLQAKTGTAATQYVYSLGTRPVAENEAAAWEYLLPDPLGSVRQIANSSAEVTWRTSYDPYGNKFKSAGSATSSFGYAGEQADSTGLIYLRARYMQPGSGIFLSRDAWTGDENRPLTFNGFVYAHANPVNLTDGSGLCVGWCVPGRLAYVKNAPAGLSLRTTPNRSSDINLIRRFKNGTPVIIKHGGPRYLDDAVWYPVAVAGLTGYEGWMAERDWRGGNIEHLTHVPPTPAPPPGGDSPPPSGDAKWVSPFGAGVGYLKGYRFTGVNDHNGIDLVSANDPFALAGQLYYGVDGLAYINGAICPTYDDYPGDIDGRKVVAVASGTIEWSNPKGTGRDSSVISLMYSDAEGYTYRVQYVHVNPADSVVAGTQVNAGDLLGWYGPYGTFGEILHLHLGLQVDQEWEDPEPYLP